MKPLVMLLGLFVFSPAFSKELGFKEFVSKAEQMDPEFKKIKNELMLREFQGESLLPNKGLTLESTGEYAKDLSGNSDELNTAYTVGAEKEILNSGTSLSVNYIRRRRSDRSEELTQIRLEQDLLKNSLGRDTRARKRIIESQNQQTSLENEELREAYFLKLAHHYLDFVQSYRDYQLADYALQEAKTLRAHVAEKRKNRIANRADLSQARLDVLEKEEAWIAKKNLYEAQLQIVYDLTGIKFSGAVQGLEDFHKNLDRFLNSLGSSGEKSSRKRKIAVLNTQRSQQELQLARRAGLPDLSLYTGLELDNSERFSSAVNRKDWVVGLELTWLLGDSHSRAEKIEARYNLHKTQFESLLTEREINQDAVSIDLRLAEARRLQKLSQEKAELSSSIVKDFDRRYKNGQLELSELILKKSEQVELQSEAQSRRTEMSKVALNYLELQDKLLEFKEKF